MSARRLLVAAVLAVALPIATLAIASPSGASPPPFTNVHVSVAGADTAHCGSIVHPCATITYALTRVTGGGTIWVGPGTFASQLVISAPVSIIGSGASTVIDPTTLPVADTDTDTALPQYAIVDVTASYGHVALANLTVNGAGASSTFTSCADDFLGVYFHSSSGSLNNVNVENIQLPTALFGCQDGTGVYVNDAPGAPVAVTIANSSVTTYDKNGIACDDVGVNCTILGSTVTGIGPTSLIAQNGIQIYSASSADIENDTVSQNSYTDPGALASDPTTYGDIYAADGILVINAGNLLIHHDTVTANDENIDLLEDASAPFALSATPAEGLWQVTNDNLSGAVNNSGLGDGFNIGDGLDIDSTLAGVIVRGDTLSNEPEFGIGMFGATGVAALGDAAVGDSIAYFAAGPGTAGNESTGDLFADDSATNSVLFGFLVNATPVQETADLTFIGDSSFGSGVSDVTDQSVGAGTLGTDDLWIATACSTSTPVGLCISNHPGGHFHFGFGFFGPGWHGGFRFGRYFH